MTPLAHQLAERERGGHLLFKFAAETVRFVAVDQDWRAWMKVSLVDAVAASGLLAAEGLSPRRGGLRQFPPRAAQKCCGRGGCELPLGGDLLDAARTGTGGAARPADLAQRRFGQLFPQPGPGSRMAAGLDLLAPWRQCARPRLLPALRRAWPVPARHRRRLTFLRDAAKVGIRAMAGAVCRLESCVDSARRGLASMASRWM